MSKMKEVPALLLFIWITLEYLIPVDIYLNTCFQNNDDSSCKSDASQASIPCCVNLKKSSVIRPEKVNKHDSPSKRPEPEWVKDEQPGKISPSSSQVRFLPKSSTNKGKGSFKSIQLNDAKVYSTNEFLVNNFWDGNKAEVSKKFAGFFKNPNIEEDDLDVPIKKRRMDINAENIKSPPYTREFHTLTEVQKSRILNTVEDTIKKLAIDDYYKGSLKNDRDILPPGSERSNEERVVCRKFLLPWVLMKVTEMILCHMIQLTFLSDDTYYKRKDEFLPIVVTYYLTLFVIVISLLVHISCFSYGGLQNPCYFMGIISSSILTLTTTMGLLIMLSMINYFRSYRQILVLFFISVLVFLFFVELCLFYVEVKSIWNKMDQIEQDYVT